MTPTLDDYWRAVDAFVAAMSRSGDDLRGIVLWGSLARNEAVPGKSDLLDAVVVTADGVLGERERQEQIVQEILDACSAMAETGLPFVHPPHLYGVEEVGDMDDLYRPTLVSPHSSQSLLGEDLRPMMLGSPDGRTIASCAFFAQQRRFMHQLSLFLLPQRTLSEADQGTILHRLTAFRKSFPVLACAAFGRSVNQADALEDLRQALPEIDFSVFDDIGAIRRGERAIGQPEELRTLLQRALDTGEQVNERVLVSRTEHWNSLIVAEEAYPERP